MAKPRMLHCTHWGMVCPAETPGMYTAPHTRTHSMIVIVVIVVCFLFTCFYCSESDVPDVFKATSCLPLLRFPLPLSSPPFSLTSLLTFCPSSLPIFLSFLSPPFHEVLPPSLPSPKFHTSIFPLLFSPPTLALPHISILQFLSLSVLLTFPSIYIILFSNPFISTSLFPTLLPISLTYSTFFFSFFFLFCHPRGPRCRASEEFVFDVESQCRSASRLENTRTHTHTCIHTNIHNFAHDLFWSFDIHEMHISYQNRGFQTNITHLSYHIVSI